MLLMKEAILADERNSGVGDDLLRKTKTEKEEKRKATRGEKTLERGAF